MIGLVLAAAVATGKFMVSVTIVEQVADGYERVTIVY